METPGSSAAPKRLLGPRAPFATQRSSPNSRVKSVTIKLVSPRRWERRTSASVWTMATDQLAVGPVAVAEASGRRVPSGSGTDSTGTTAPAETTSLIAWSTRRVVGMTISSG